MFPLSLFSSPAADILQRVNCCNFSAGIVSHWNIMDKNEAALAILLSKNLCKAISNLLSKKSLALHKKKLHEKCGGCGFSVRK